MIEIQASYFAVIDPLDPNVLTLWYRSTRGKDCGKVKELGPRYRRSIVRTDIPHLAGSKEAHAWLLEYWTRARAARAQILASIKLDPATHAAMFAATASKCVCCGRALRDPGSRAAGIGPECVQSVPATLANAIKLMLATIRNEVAP